MTRTSGLSPAEDRVVVAEWSRRIPPIMARIPEVRIGTRWYSIAWLIPIVVVGLIVGIAVCQQLRTYPAVQSWIASHPGTGDFQPAVTTGFPLWLRILHFLNLLFMLFIIRAGIQILADHPRLATDAGCKPGREWLRLRGPVPPDRMAQEPPERAWTAKDDAVTLPRWLGIPGIRHSIGLARWWHFSCDFLWVLTGVAFYVLLFTTGQWARLVPLNWSVFTNAISTAIQYGSLNFPANKGWTQYNGLQIISYFVVVFIAAPLAFITGLLQAPAIAARFGLGWGRLNRQIARTVHFGVLVTFVGFIFIHTRIQGWSGVAKWGGVPKRDILDLVQPKPEARFAVFYSFAEGGEGGLYYDAHKIEHMRHHLTILAYEMNGEPLNELHGAPLRLRNELELGFKQVKWIRAIEFVEASPSSAPARRYRLERVPPAMI